MRRALLATGLLLIFALAGCLGDQVDTDRRDLPTGPDGQPLDPAEITFTEPVIIDDTRAGGEPVIAITHNGSVIVSAHPGWTHYHPSEDPTHLGTELIEPASGQSYLWRSTDDGSTWTHIGLPANESQGQGPRGAGFGVSDPDLTVTPSNKLYHTDLEALASASVSWSTDDGKTWIEGNPVASGGAVDRQWLTSYEETVYFTANYFTDHRILRSTDGGITWERVGDVPCRGDINAGPGGELYAGCGSGVAASLDNGATWTVSRVPDHVQDINGSLMEPAVDSAGNVWITWQANESQVYLAGSPDQGESWPWVHDVTDELRQTLGNTSEMTAVWPWVSAGSRGRVAVSAYVTPTAPPSDAGPSDRVWSVASVVALGADTDRPMTAGHLVADGHHEGPICQSGTACQAGSVQGEENSDRRLGDFFESTIDAEGRLHVVYSDTTTHPEDVISHVGYVRMDAGPSLVQAGILPRQG